jgi:hypothetical protein
MNQQNSAPRETSSTAGPASACNGLPAPGFIELIELRGASIEHRLGYFRSEPFIIFGYCPGGGEVIWKDGHSSGFGAGGWKILLQELASLAARYDAFLGDLTRAGTHVLFMDRASRKMYAAPREAAEEFMAQLYHIPGWHRRCLCSLMDCTTCPLRARCQAFTGGTPSNVVASLQSSHAATSSRGLAIPLRHERTTQ